ncbi:MAG: asparagine synthase (glutamine-hydrolyzing) [Thermodesulfobacteriota bacterium]
MCGLTGFMAPHGSAGPDRLTETVGRMAEAIRHRGPDDAGVWIEPEVGLALGHRRLSIIDLSPEGHQPMISAGGRYVIAYNGEVYSFTDMRRDLEGLGRRFRGRSDTEVILAALEEWGLEAAVARFVGMFAIALWDRKERRLHLVRDRLGIKPLYYGWMNGVFLFGSELKALRAHPAWNGQVDRDVLALFLRHNYIPSPYSIYRGVYTLMPGTILTVSPEETAPASFSPLVEGGDSAALRPQAFWSAKEVAEAGVRRPFPGSDQEAADKVEELLLEAVRCRMIADVPLGAFLSGGIDSSTIVALMTAAGSGPVKTFTIGFPEEIFNEAHHAQAVARHLGTDHTEMYVTGRQALEVIPKLPVLFDEPFSDSSQIPTYLVAELTRRHVTVSLSGDGGDEIFAGYTRYFDAPRLWSYGSWLPVPLKPVAARTLTSIPPPTWTRLFKLLGPLLPEALRHRDPGDTIHKVAEILGAESPRQIYRRLTSHFKRPAEIVIGAVEPPTAFTDEARQAQVSDFLRWMMYLDLISYHPDDILVKVDRASMAVALEARVPMIDHRVVEFAATLPSRVMVRNGEGKWILRRILSKYVPPELWDRPKTGFGVPLGQWLRGPLKEWAEELLSESRLRRDGYFHPEPILTKWKEHLSLKRDWHYYLWDVLVFQAWLDAQRP